MDKILNKRLLKLLYDHNEEHIGSCFTCVNIIDNIYFKKDKNDIFILSNGHAAYALYSVLEKYYEDIDADKLVKKHGGHPNRDLDDKIFCSTGSLGSGIVIGVGMALANQDKKVYILISDGECAEGSVWEALRFIYEYKIENIEIHVNMNGYSCYDLIDTNYLEKRLMSFLPKIIIHRTNSNVFPGIVQGLDAHYVKLNEVTYLKCLTLIENEWS